MFLLLALVNLLHPFAGPYMTWVAALVLLVHVLEIVLLHGCLQRQAQPWRDRLQVLLFGVLHVRGFKRMKYRKSRADARLFHGYSSGDIVLLML